jgi:hypothetical protein
MSTEVLLRMLFLRVKKGHNNENIYRCQEAFQMKITQPIFMGNKN